MSTFHTLPITHYSGKEKPEVVAIIPARGGSKGIPRKNIVDLCGKPLIAYSIEVALNSKCITRVVVSTDDEEVAEISKEYGAEVPFLRPKHLAEDRAKINDALKYTLKRLKLEGYSPDAHAVLYPTHLFRNPKLINSLIEKLFEGYSQIMTARPIKVHQLSYFVLNSETRLIPFFDPGKYCNEKDHLFFRPDGLFSAENMTGVQQYGSYAHHLNDQISLIDIDTYTDLYVAEEIIKSNLFDFDLQ